MRASAPRLPNFLVIGAAKSGTTALYHFLRQHPQVYMSPEKEPRFFICEGRPPDYRGPYEDGLINKMTIWKREDYEALFAGARDQLARGEATPSYLWFPGAPERIQALLPRARLVAILRQPADRAFSHYMMHRRDGREPLSFEDALRAEPERLAAHWYWGRYRQAGYYHRHLSRYYDRFAREQIRVYLYDDLVRDPAALLRDLFGFLGVDEGVTVNTGVRYNLSGIIASPLLRAIWAGTNRPRAFIRPLVPRRLRQRVAGFFTTRKMIRLAMREETRAELMADYREDILKLQDLIGRDLSNWLR